MGGQRHTRWLAAAKRAARQHGVVTRSQLLGLGISRREIESALRDGRLCALHRGVYLFGPTPTPLTHHQPATITCGPGARLSHRSAGKLWKLLPYVANPATIHVSVPGRDPGARPGLTIHRVTAFLPEEVTTKHGIPVTSPARTLLDLAATAIDDGDLEQAIAQAFANRFTSRARLDALIDKRRGHRGARRLRAHLAGTPARTRSRTERRLLTRLRQAGVPEPEINAPLGHWEVDMLWRDRRLAVEIDGYDSHSSPKAFERDYRKTAELEALGLRVVRVSADQVWNDLDATVARVAAA